MKAQQFRPNAVIRERSRRTPREGSAGTLCRHGFPVVTYRATGARLDKVTGERSFFTWDKPDDTGCPDQLRTR